MIHAHISRKFFSPLIRGVFCLGFVCSSLWGSAARSDEAATRPTATQPATYTTRGNQILKNGVPCEWRGVDAMYEFGGAGDVTKEWPTIDIMRETMQFMSVQPVEGPPLNVNGKNIHSLQSIVDHNRSRGQVTLFSAHGWDGTRATWFQSRNPRETPWWDAYKVRYRAIAAHFKDQPDVWFSVWNEPYHWLGEQGYSDEMWLRDMREMVDNIRSTGAQNIIVVPGSHNGGGEKVIINQGPKLLVGRSNLIFDIHAYNPWIGNDGTPRPQAEIKARLQAILDAGVPVLVGEYGTWNNNWLASVTPLLNACRELKISTMAWAWQVGADQNALRKTGVEPNDTEQNHNYGSTVKAYLAEPRNLPIAP